MDRESAEFRILIGSDCFVIFYKAILSHLFRDPTSTKQSMQSIQTNLVLWYILINLNNLLYFIRAQFGFFHSFVA